MNGETRRSAFPREFQMGRSTRSRRFPRARYSLKKMEIIQSSGIKNKDGKWHNSLLETVGYVKEIIKLDIPAQKVDTALQKFRMFL
jgi:hypothetical protein